MFATRLHTILYNFAPVKKVKLWINAIKTMNMAVVMNTTMNIIMNIITSHTVGMNTTMNTTMKKAACAAR